MVLSILFRLPLGVWEEQRLTFFFSFFFFEKSNTFLIFPIVKFSANYAEIGRVGKMEISFQHVPLVHTF